MGTDGWVSPDAEEELQKIQSFTQCRCQSQWCLERNKIRWLLSTHISVRVFLTKGCVGIGGYSYVYGLITTPLCFEVYDVLSNTLSNSRSHSHSCLFRHSLNKPTLCV